MKKKLKWLIGVSSFILAVVLTAYPFIANYIFENGTDSIIKTIDNEASKNSNLYEKEIKEIKEYNDLLANGNVVLTDPFDDEILGATTDYERLANMTEDGVMGYIEIPSIDVSLPIYHGTSSRVLEKGVGHIEHTSIPIGGNNTHSVLTGHSGLSKAKLFTDIPLLKEGDIFLLNVMGQKLAYKVYDTEVVLPEEVSNLKIVNGKDICTLITCTPYGINTHRLFVHGEAVDYDSVINTEKVQHKTSSESKWMEEYKKAVYISFLVLIGAVISLIVTRKIISLRDPSKFER